MLFASFLFCCVLLVWFGADEKNKEMKNKDENAIVEIINSHCFILSPNQKVYAIYFITYYILYGINTNGKERKQNQ